MQSQGRPKPSRPGRAEGKAKQNANQRESESESKSKIKTIQTDAKAIFELLGPTKVFWQSKPPENDDTVQNPRRC